MCVHDTLCVCVFCGCFNSIHPTAPLRPPRGVIARGKQWIFACLSSCEPRLCGAFFRCDTDDVSPSERQNPQSKEPLWILTLSRINANKFLPSLLFPDTSDKTQNNVTCSYVAGTHYYYRSKIKASVNNARYLNSRRSSLSVPTNPAFREQLHTYF